MWSELWEKNKDALQKLIEDQWVFEDYKKGTVASDWETLAEFIGKTVFKYDSSGNPCGFTKYIDVARHRSGWSGVLIFGTTPENLMVNHIMVGYEDYDLIDEADTIDEVMSVAKWLVDSTHKIFDDKKTVKVRDGNDYDDCYYATMSE